jgi:hypothetical protein
MRLDVIEARPVMQRAATQADVDQVGPPRSSNHIDTSHTGPNVLTGGRLELRQNLRQWLSPPNPSTNHTIARRAHHQGTATWFFQGNIYNEWKATPSLLWIHGKRAPPSQFLPDTASRHLMFSRRGQEHSMVCGPFTLYFKDD